MSSSPITPARMQLPGRPDLMTLFESVPDPRHRRGVRHALPVILAVGVAAVLTGARSFAAIGEWVADQSEPALARLGVGTGPRPTESTIRRTFARLDADLLDQVIGAYLSTRTRVLSSDDTRVTFSVGDVMTLPLSGGYDAITCLAVVHHLPFAVALRHVRQKLAPGGTLVVLGLYREQTRSDRLLRLAAIPANLALGWLRARNPRGGVAQLPGPMAMTAPTRPAEMRLSEIRLHAAHELPGSRVRRHLFWRYSLVYRTKPAGTS
jgi:SAM-dependent methyltransferase